MPIGTDTFVRNFVTKACRNIIDDVEKLDRVEESTRLEYTQLVGELEHLKTETRLIDEMFASEMGECVFLMR